MEEYITDTSLRQTLDNTAYPDLVVRCVVLSTVPLRTCEFSDDRVFTAVGSIAPCAPSHIEACGAVVRVNFYGLWGMAAAFIDPGDVVILQGFYRLEAPCTPAISENSACSSTTSSPIYLCPLPEEKGCVLRVLQPGKGGDVMEVLVTPSNMDAICLRGLTASDASNHLYVRQCLACADTKK
jgi:hypothetical protein